MSENNDLEFSIVLVIVLGIVVSGLWGEYAGSVGIIWEGVLDWLKIRLVFGILVLGLTIIIVILSKLFSGNITKRFKSIV
jgi:hypothetical protein